MADPLAASLTPFAGRQPFITLGRVRDGKTLNPATTKNGSITQRLSNEMLAAGNDSLKAARALGAPVNPEITRQLELSAAIKTLLDMNGDYSIGEALHPLTDSKVKGEHGTGERDAIVMDRWAAPILTQAKASTAQFFTLLLARAAEQALSNDSSGLALTQEIAQKTIQHWKNSEALSGVGNRNSQQYANLLRELFMSLGDPHKAPKVALDIQKEIYGEHPIYQHAETAIPALTEAHLEAVEASRRLPVDQEPAIPEWPVAVETAATQPKEPPKGDDAKS